MNFIKQIACGFLATTLPSVAAFASTHSAMKLKSEPNFLGVALMQLSSMGQQALNIQNDTVAQSGFAPSSFTIHLPKDSSKVPAYCGYDEKSGKIVPIKLSSCQMLFGALTEALHYVIKRDNTGIFEHLYGKDNAKIYKELWVNPYGAPEAKLTALTGFIYNKDNGELKIDKISTMSFDAEEFIRSQSAGSFFPWVFSVTYDRFLQIQQQYPNINFLEGIEKLLTYKKTLD